MAKGSRGRSPAPAGPNSFGIRYSRELGLTIAERLAQGEVWSRMHKEAGMPSYTALYDWKKRRPEFAEMLAQAREALADLHADKALQVAEAATPESVSRDRLHVSTLQWRADRVTKGGKDAERERPRLLVEIRRFEKVTRPDGSVVVRAIKNAAH